jgi:hypothetical protein
MFGSDILDIAVGLVFVYLLASLIVSTITELFAGWLGWRADKLLDGIRNLINSPGAKDWAQELYEHPLIKGMSPLPTKVFAIGKFQLAPQAPGPSYIPARAFSAALVGLIQNSQPTVVLVTNALQGILRLASDPHTSAADIKKAILQIADNVPVTSPPGALDLRIKADLQSLANKIPDSDVTFGQLTTGVQAIVNNLSDTDPTQANLKRDLQNLVPGARAVSVTVDQLKNSLQTVADNITGYSAPLLAIKNDLQTLVKNIPGETDSATTALELVRIFVNNVWERYLADIISEIPNGKLRTALTTLLQQTEGNLESFKTAVETWFNDSMDRVSGWYKRHTQWVQLILAAGLTFVLNLDSVSIVRALSEDNSGLLKTMAANAEKFVEQTSNGSKPTGSPQPSPTPASLHPDSPENSSNPAETLGQLRAELGDLMLPMGWTSGPPVPSVKKTDFRQWPGLPWVDSQPGQWLGNFTDCVFNGDVNFDDAKFLHSLEIVRCHFNGEVSARRMKVGSDFVIRGAVFMSQGPVVFSNAQIDGSLFLKNTRFQCEKGVACEQMSVSQDASLSNLKFAGVAHFQRCVIGHELVIEGCSFDATDNAADFSSITAQDDVLVSSCRFSGGTSWDYIHARGVYFSHQTSFAQPIRFTGLVVNRSMSLETVEVGSGVSVENSEISEDLNLTGLTVRSSSEKQNRAQDAGFRLSYTKLGHLKLASVSIPGGLVFEEDKVGTLDLTNYTPPYNSHNRCKLANLSVEHFEADDSDHRHLLELINSFEFDPTVYFSLEKFYASLGDTGLADETFIKRNDRFEDSQPKDLGWLGQTLVGILAGYGRDPKRSLTRA